MGTPLCPCPGRIRWPDEGVRTPCPYNVGRKRFKGESRGTAGVSRKRQDRSRSQSLSWEKARGFGRYGVSKPLTNRSRRRFTPLYMPRPRLRESDLQAPRQLKMTEARSSTRLGGLLEKGFPASLRGVCQSGLISLIKHRDHKLRYLL